MHIFNIPKLVSVIKQGGWSQTLETSSELAMQYSIVTPCCTIVGHFGHGRFGLGCFGPDISATENAKGGRFGQNHKLWVGVCACINV